MGILSYLLHYPTVFTPWPPEHVEKNDTVTNVMKMSRTQFRALAYLCLCTIFGALMTVLVTNLNKPLTEVTTIAALMGLFCCIVMLLIVDRAKRQRNEMEAQAAENAARYNAIIAASKTGAWEYHSDTQYQWCSPEYFEMLGFDKSYYADNQKFSIQDIWVRLLHPDDRQKAVDTFTNYVQTKRTDMYEATFRMKHFSGEWRWIWSRGRTLLRPDGTVSNITLGTHIDITDRKNMEINLVTYNEKLIKYAHMTAHEVRGPLARLLGLIQLSRMTKDADYPWFFDKVKGEAHDIDKILKEISEELSEIDEHHTA